MQWCSLGQDSNICSNNRAAQGTASAVCSAHSNLQHAMKNDTYTVVHMQTAVSSCFPHKRQKGKHIKAAASTTHPAESIRQPTLRSCQGELAAAVAFQEPGCCPPYRRTACQKLMYLLMIPSAEQTVMHATCCLQSGQSVVVRVTGKCVLIEAEHASPILMCKN